jgi:hypothetical protein
MKTSESITKIAPALLKAQKEMEGAKKDSANPFFKSRYSDFNSVLEACKGPLNANGISILQPHKMIVLPEGNFMVVETILLHESGEYISGETKVEVTKAHDPQALGSAQTYAKRYGLQSIVSLPSEDDDGEGAMGRKQASSVPAKPASQPAKSAPAPSAGGFGGGFGSSAPKASPEVKQPAKAPARSGSFGQ